MAKIQTVKRNHSQQTQTTQPQLKLVSSHELEVLKPQCRALVVRRDATHLCNRGVQPSQHGLVVTKWVSVIYLLNAYLLAWQAVHGLQDFQKGSHCCVSDLWDWDLLPGLQGVEANNHTTKQSHNHSHMH